MIYAAIIIDVAILLLGLVLSAWGRLGRGLLAFSLMMLFTICTGYIMGTLMSPSGSGWVIVVGAFLIGPLAFLRYYYRERNRGQ